MTPAPVLPAPTAEPEFLFVHALPTPEFLAAPGARRLHIYLWQAGRCRFLRLPGGAGLYTVREEPVALGFPDGSGLRRNGAERLASSARRAAGAFFPDFRPGTLSDLTRAHREAESVTRRLRASAVRELREKFAEVPVTVEDAWAAGNCWYGTAEWPDLLFGGEPAPSVGAVLKVLDQLPGNEKAAFIASCAVAAAYVVAGRQALAGRGVGPAEVEAAVRAGFKAGAAGELRVPLLNRRRSSK